MAPGERAYIQDLIEAIDGSVIGASYIAEYSDRKGIMEPGYFCTLCSLRLDPAQALHHIVSDQHAMTYLKANRNKQYMALCIGTLGEEVRRQMKARYLDEIAREEAASNRKITKKLDLGPADPYSVFYFHKKVMDNLPDVQPKRSAGESGGQRGWAGGRDKDERSGGGGRREEAAERVRMLAELESQLPPFSQRNVEEGWYSIRSKSCDYFRRLALQRNPDALVYSIRAPEAKENFYGEWNPQLMRRLQDKFNFSLDHMSWLQKLLTDWHVPAYTKLLMADLRPLENEVEASVLTELVDQILKPVNPLRYMQVFEYENYDHIKAPPPEPEISKRQARLENVDLKPRDRDHGSRRIQEEPEIEEIIPAPDPKKPVAIKLAKKEQKRIQLNPEVAAKLGQADESSDDEGAAPALTEVESKLYRIIDSVLAIARDDTQTKNPVLELLTEFRKAREILFTLARRQPTQLQQLVTVTQNPALVVPPGVIDQLRRKLREIEEEAERERVARKRKRREGGRSGSGRRQSASPSPPSPQEGASIPSDPSIPFYMRKEQEDQMRAQQQPPHPFMPQMQQQMPPQQSQSYYQGGPMMNQQWGGGANGGPWIGGAPPGMMGQGPLMGGSGGLMGQPGPGMGAPPMGLQHQGHYYQGGNGQGPGQQRRYDYSY